MKTSICLLLLFWIFKSGIAQQEYQYRWHREYTICNSGNVVGVASLNDGGILELIIHGGSEDIDPSPMDILVPTGGTLVKYDSQKQLEWYLNFPNMQSGKILIDSLHNSIYIYANYSNSFDSDPGPTTTTFATVGQYSSYIIKLSLDGNFIWSKNIVNTSANNAYVLLTGLDVKESGNLILYGSYKNGVDFDLGPDVQLFQTPDGGSGYPITQGFLVEWNGEGEFVKGFSLGESDYGFNTSNVEVLNQNVFFSCSLYGELDADADSLSSTVVGLPDAVSSFIIKYDTNFVFKDVASYSNGVLQQIATGYEDELIISGSYVADFDADPSGNIDMLVHGGSSVYYQQYFIKLDTAFNYEWSFYNTYAGSGEIGVTKIVLVSDGSIHTIGNFKGEYDVDPGTGTYLISNTSNGNFEPYVLQYDNGGNFVSAHTFYHIGTNYPAYSGDIDVNPDHSMLVGVRYTGTTDVDPGSDTLGVVLLGTNPKPLLVEFVRCTPQYVEIYDTICDGQDFQFGNQNYSTSGIYSYSYLDINDCDSIVTLNLTVNQLNTELTSTNYGNLACIDTNALSYSWMNCNSGFIVSGVNTYAFSPMDDQDYAVIVSDGICADTSNCLNVSQGSNFGVPELDWAAGITGFTGGEQNSLAVDPDGNIYVTGNIQSIVNMELFGGVSSFYQSPNSLDIMVAKYDNNGAFLWGFPAGIQGNSSIPESGYALDFDTDGNVYVAGLFERTIDIDPDEYNIALQMESAPYGVEVFLIKINPNGQLLWNKTLGAQGVFMTLEDLDVAPNGEIVVCGSNGGQPADFDPGPGTFTQTGKAFAAKYSSNGDFNGLIDLPGLNSIVKAATFDKDNNLILSGAIYEDADFDMGPGVAMLDVPILYDVREFIVSYNDTLGLNWVHGLDPSGDENSHSALDTDDEGNIFFTGVNSGQVDFSGNEAGSGPSVFTFYGGFLVKYASDGTFLQKFPFSFEGSYLSNSISVNQKNEVLFAGKAYDGVTVTVDASTVLPMANGGTFVIKYANDASESWAFEIEDYSSGGGPISIASDEFGNFFLMGDGFGASPFDVDPTDSTYMLSAPDAYLAKYGESCSPINNSYQLNGTTVTVADNGYYYFKDCITGTIVDSGFVNTFTPCSSGNYYALLKMGNCYDSTSCFTINAVSDLSTTLTDITVTANNPSASYVWLDCDDNFAPISGETAQSFTPTENGNYAVQLTQNGCVDTSDCVAIATVGIVENTMTEEFVLFPNPTSGEVKIVFENEQQELTVSLLSITGQLLKSKTYQSSEAITFEIDGPVGVYLLKLNSNGEEATIRVMKE